MSPPSKKKRRTSAPKRIAKAKDKGALPQAELESNDPIGRAAVKIWANLERIGDDMTVYLIDMLVGHIADLSEARARALAP